MVMKKIGMYGVWLVDRTAEGGYRSILLGIDVL
jgi:hypothetical protein